MTTRWALARLHLGVALLAGTPLFARGLHLPPEWMTGIRCLFASVALFVLIMLSKGRLWPAKRDLPWVGAMAVLMTAHWWTYFAGIQAAGVALGVAAFFCFPFLTALAEPFCEGARPRIREMILALIGFGGILFAMPWTGSGTGTWWGVLLGVLSGALFAARNLIARHRLRHHGAIPLMAWQTLGVAVLLVPWNSGEFHVLESRHWILLGVLGLVFTAGAHTLFASSLREISARKAGQIAALQPIYAPLYAGIVLSEWPAWNTWVGAGVIVSLVVYESRTRN